MLTLIVVAITCGYSSYKMNMIANTMTSPRKSFDAFTGPLYAVIGGVIGIFTGFAEGATLKGILIGLVTGLVAGLLALGAARMQRGR